MGYTQEEADDIVRDTRASMVPDNARITEGVERINASRLSRGEAIIKIPRSISHCGHCGQPTLEHDDERCRAVIDEKAARAILHNLNALAGQFEAKRLIGIKQLVDELWAQSATWPRTPWWLRMWNRVRSWF